LGRQVPRTRWRKKEGNDESESPHSSEGGGKALVSKRKKGRPGEEKKRKEGSRVTPARKKKKGRARAAPSKRRREADWTPSFERRKTFTRQGGRPSGKKKTCVCPPVVGERGSPEARSRKTGPRPDAEKKKKPPAGQRREEEIKEKKKKNVLSTRQRGALLQNNRELLGALSEGENT